MPTELDRDEVRNWVNAGAQLVEVLPPEEYQPVHLPGAINIPLGKLDRHTAGRLRRELPVICYCQDYQ